MFKPLGLGFCLLMAILGCSGGISSPLAEPFPMLALSATKAPIGPKGITRIQAVTSSGRPVPALQWWASSGTLGAPMGPAVDFTAGPERGDVTVTAQIPGDTRTYTLVVPVVALSLGVTPSTSTIGVLDTLPLTVYCSPDQGEVVWSATGGTFTDLASRSAVYQAPSTPGSYTVTVHSADDHLAVATAQVTVLPAQSLVINPPELFMAPWGVAQLTLTVAGLPSGPYVWSASGGTLSNTGDTGTFWQAPGEREGDYLITVAAKTRPSLSASCLIHATTAPLPSIYVDMPVTRVAPGGTLALNARTLNAADPRVVFTPSRNPVDPVPAGALDSAGVLHAPAEPVRRDYRFTATSVQYPLLSMNFAITVNPRTWSPDHAVAGQPVQFTYASPDAPGLIWNWQWASLSLPPGAAIAPGGWYTTPPQSCFQWFNVTSSAPGETFEVDVQGVGPFTLAAAKVPKGAWDAWIPRPDGSVVIFGGLASRDVVRADPATGTVTRLGEMKYHHYFGKAFDLGGDRVLIMGGDETGGTYVRPQRLEIFDLTQGKTVWSRVDDFVAWLTERMVLKDGRLLLAGIHQVNPPALPEEAGFRLFDPVTLTLSPVYPFPNGAHRPTLTLAQDGTVLVSGGYDLSGSDVFGVQVDAVYRWNPNTGAFTTLGRMNLATCFHTASELPDGRLLILGGRSQYNSYGERGAELFNPATGLSQAVGAMALPRYQHAAQWLDSTRLLIFGGCDSGLLELLDLTTGKVTAAGSLFLPSYAPGAYFTGGSMVVVASTGHLESAPLSAFSILARTGVEAATLADRAPGAGSRQTLARTLGPVAPMAPAPRGAQPMEPGSCGPIPPQSE